MSEDEAFIRKIVDSPGDDLPRLVYADWLDERSDVRGSYLRAELEWAKEKQTTGSEVLLLNEMAGGLDPVWVARVSRPPMGVCCDHLRFSNCGTAVPVSEIMALEEETTDRGRKYGGQPEPLFRGFPTDYKAFVLNYNGGDTGPLSVPVPSVDLVRSFTAHAKFRFHVFGEQIPFEDPAGPSGLWLDLARSIEAAENTVRPDEVILRLDHEHAGLVYYLSAHFHDWYTGEFAEVAASLPLFLHLARPMASATW